MNNLLKDAIGLAVDAHEGQFRRDGTTPYISHPLAVMDMMDTNEEKIVAVLHDVFEDTKYTLERSMNRRYFAIVSPKGSKLDIPESVYSALTMLTHVKGISYESYIGALHLSNIAKKVKIADMFHNMSGIPTDKKKEKYFNALCVLLKAT